MRYDLKHGGEYGKILEKRKRLEGRIADSYGVPQARVFLSNGSNGALEYIFGAFATRHLLTEGLKPTALIDLPNYFETMKFLEKNGYNIIKVPRLKGFDYPLEGMLCRLFETDILVLTTPNNPTGIPISDAQLDALLLQTPGKAWIIVDRTCLNTMEEVATRQLLIDHEGRNLIVLHSYSKSHGLSAARIGHYVCANDECASFLREREDIGRVGLPAMDLLLEHFEDEKTVSLRKDSLRQSMAFLRELAYIHPEICLSPSSSNFLLIRLDRSVADRLAKRFEFAASADFGLNDEDVYRLNLENPQHVETFVRELERSFAAKRK